MRKMLVCPLSAVDPRYHHSLSYPVIHKSEMWIPMKMWITNSDCWSLDIDWTIVHLFMEAIASIIYCICYEQHFWQPLPTHCSLAFHHCPATPRVESSLVVGGRIDICLFSVDSITVFFNISITDGEQESHRGVETQLLFKKCHRSMVLETKTSICGGWERFVT